MKPNVWNIKEVLSIPPGSSGTRNTSGHANTSGYSSLFDSQFVFGSQLWPDNSQGSVPSRHSQQSSQEGSEKRISSNYHTKPFLFGGDGKDKGITPVSVLDRFDEDKKKAKEKNESDMLAKESLHFRETLHNMQQSILGTENNITVCKTILEGFDHFAVTLQQNQSSLQDAITQQFETMLKEVLSQKQMLTHIQGKLQETEVSTTELSSYVHGLEKSLEALRQEHKRGTKQLGEAMQLLSTLVSNHSTRSGCGGVVDSAIQTSPGLRQQVLKLQPDSQPKGKVALFCQPEFTQQSDVSSLQPRGSSNQENKHPQRSHRRMKRRPLLLPKRRKNSIWEGNSQPLIKGIKRDVSSQVKEICNEAATACRKGISVIHHYGGCRSNEGLKAFVSPFSPWSQDSNSSVCVAGIEPTIKAEIPEEATGLWQLFDINCDSDSTFVEE